MNEVLPLNGSELATPAERSATGTAGALLARRPELAKALAHAIGACAAVEKSSVNQHHKYAYASADAIIEVGRKALSEAGLVMLPIEAAVNGWEREGENRFELCRTFLLIHSSGESAPLRVVWPICPDKGRPLDKATAIADTLSLSYLLRDLLLMARVDPSDEMHARDDRPRPEKPAKKPRSPLPADGAELEARLVKYEQALVAAGRCKAGELIAHVCEQYRRAWPEREVPPMPQWDAHAIRLADDARRTFAANHPDPQPASSPAAAPSPPAPSGAISQDQLRDLLALMERKGGEKVHWPRIQFAFGLRSLTPASLPASVYAEAMRRLGEDADAPAGRK